MSAINAYLGAYHLVLALRRSKAREHLPFALLCLAVAAYEVFCVGLYSADGIAQGVFWQRAQLQLVVVIALMTVWFIARLTGNEHDRGIRMFMAWFVLLAPLTLLEGHGLTLSTATPSVKHIVLGGRAVITYHESEVGPLFTLEIVSAFTASAYLVYLLVRHYRRRRSRNLLAIVVGNIAYLAGAANDSLVTVGAYSFVYVSEYAFFVLTLSMAYVLLNKFVDLQSDVEALNADLERAVAQRTAALERSLEQQRAMQQQLVAASRRAGMSDVATDVLHNIGNTLNSVNVSVSVLEDAVRQSRLQGLVKVAAMLGEHQGDLPAFFTDDARAKRLPEYLLASTARLEGERSSLAGELASLRRHVEQIKVVVETQRSHTGGPAASERTALAALLDEALSLSLLRHPVGGVELERDYAVVPDIEIDRHKLLLIVAQLLDHAWAAIAPTARKRIRLRLRAEGGDRAAIAVEDSGRGIAPENLTRMFHQGAPDNLHASACAAAELGGTLVAASDGLDRGACLTLTVPLRIAPRLAVAAPSGDDSVHGTVLLLRRPRVS